MTTSVEMAIQLGWKHYNPMWSEDVNTENARTWLIGYYTSNSRQPFSVLDQERLGMPERSRLGPPVLTECAPSVPLAKSAPPARRRAEGSYAQAYIDGFVAGQQLDLIEAAKHGRIVKPKKPRKNGKGR